MVVVWSEDAERQMRKTFDFLNLTTDFANAKKMTLLLRESGEALRFMPFVAAKELLLEDEPKQYRSWVVSRRYKIVYRVDEPAETILIVDIWDCRQNPAALKGRAKK